MIKNTDVYEPDVLYITKLGKDRHKPCIFCKKSLDGLMFRTYVHIGHNFYPICSDCEDDIDLVMAIKRVFDD